MSTSSVFPNQRPIHPKIVVDTFLPSKWILTSVILSIFPSLPVVDKDTNNYYLLFFGVALWMLKAIHQVVQRNHFFEKLHVYVVIVFVINFVLTVKHLFDKDGLSYVNQIMSWLLLSKFFCFVLFCFFPRLKLGFYEHMYYLQYRR